MCCGVIGKERERAREEEEEGMKGARSECSLLSSPAGVSEAPTAEEEEDLSDDEDLRMTGGGEEDETSVTSLPVEAFDSQ